MLQMNAANSKNFSTEGQRKLRCRGVNNALELQKPGLTTRAPQLSRPMPVSSGKGLIGCLLKVYKGIQWSPATNG